MLESLSVVLPLTLASTLVASAIAKLRHPDDLRGWEELGVPALLRRSGLVRLHPWGELALGAALVLLGGILGLAAAVVATILMLAYLWLVVRARASAPDASCSCFGTRRRITGVTIVRNVWLAALALATAGVIWTTPLWGGALSVGATEIGWLVGLAVAAFTVCVILWPDEQEAARQATPILTSAAGDAARSQTGADDELDYIRTRTPAVPVTLADGTVVNLRHLTAIKPLLLLAVSPTCGSCTPVIERAPVWRAELPELDVRFLLQTTPEAATLIETDEPQSLHDPEGYVKDSIGGWATPTAVLFGADGMLAGGPVTGTDEIERFVADIRASLEELRATV